MKIVRKILLKIRHKMNIPVLGCLLRRRAIRKYFKENSPCCLNLGCGGNILSGWFNTDLSIGLKGCHYLDVTRKFPFPSHSFDYISSEHLLEHLKLDNAVKMLSECRRILKPGGVLRLTLPTLDFLVDLYAHPEKYRQYIHWEIDTFLPDVKKYFGEDYPEVMVINNFYRAWGHQVIYDYKTLELLLSKCGYRDIKRGELNKSEHPVFKNIEKHDSLTYDGLSEIESVVLEASTQGDVYLVSFSQTTDDPLIYSGNS